jgi:pyrimidine-nucleoside phosphorylase/thymidine phosphorylase
LKGEGPADLAALVCELIGDPRAAEVLASGKAYDKFVEMVEAQGGDLSKPLKDTETTETWVYKSPVSGVVKECDAYKIGYASVVLGGGRSQADEEINHGVGLMVHAKIGAKVSEGDALVTVYHEGKGLKDTQELLEQAYKIKPC